LRDSMKCARSRHLMTRVAGLLTPEHRMMYLPVALQQLGRPIFTNRLTEAHLPVTNAAHCEGRMYARERAAGARNRASINLLCTRPMQPAPASGPPMRQHRRAAHGYFDPQNAAHFSSASRRSS
jgi:hypothetical protein